MLRNVTRNLYLPRAYNVQVSQIINSDYRLEFTLPRAFTGAVEESDLIECEGQLYRVYQTSQAAGSGTGITVSSCHVITDAAYVLWPRFPFNIPGGLEFWANVDAKTVLALAVERSAFELYTDEELATLGYAWVDITTDYWVESNQTLKDIIENLIEQVGGELCIDNYKIAIVKEIGDQEAQHRIDTKWNAKSITKHVNAEKVITRLYGYGADDLPPKNNGVVTPYIDAPNIEDYDLVKVGYREYDNLTLEVQDAQQKIYNKMVEDIQSLCFPEISYDVEMVDLSKINANMLPLRLGDTAHLMDAVSGIDDVQRITSITYYPYEPNAPTLGLGAVKKTLKDLLLKGAR